MGTTTFTHEHPGGTGEIKGKYSKLKMLLASLELQIVPVGLQDRYMKIHILQMQGHTPPDPIQRDSGQA